MIFLNRRGYAPVLACGDCGWKSECPHCSAYRVFHKIDRTLRCHHCGFTERVPRACPECGNLDIAPVGRGTEQVEEQLAGLLADVKRPDGGPARVARMDADSTRLKGSLELQLATMHSGEVDVLVGTQMIAKGHDFRRITLVAGINADAGLFASDYRAPERLFALLMQAGGRAGRDAALVSEPGSAVVASAVRPLLARIAEALVATPGAVLVTGHTDNVPIRTLRFPSNWHLSQERAEAVRQDLGQRVPLQRLRAEGRAEAEPDARPAPRGGRDGGGRRDVVRDSSGRAPLPQRQLATVGAPAAAAPAPAPAVAALAAVPSPALASPLACAP
eukprot:gene47715-63991_t